MDPNLALIRKKLGGNGPLGATTMHERDVVFISIITPKSLLIDLEINYRHINMNIIYYRHPILFTIDT